MISSKQQSLIVDIVSEYNPTMIGIFGSYARGENDQNSDLDILIDFEPPLDLLEIIGLEQELTENPCSKITVPSFLIIILFLFRGFMMSIPR